MSDWSPQFLRAVLDISPEAIVICMASGDHPVVYANRAFAQLVGFTPEELLGSNLRRLQGGEREQDARHRLREALARGESCRAVLRNFRKDGTPFWNEMTIEPLPDASGGVSYFVGFHRAVADRPKSVERETAGPPEKPREDRLTGLATRAYLEEILRRDWATAQRTASELTLVLYDIDNLTLYNETFERSGGDACIRRIGRMLGGCYRRGSDLVARLEGGCIAALVPAGGPENVVAYARDLAQRIFMQHMHHPRAPLRYVTVSVGVASIVPPRDSSYEQLLRAAAAALARAKSLGRNCVEIAGEQDFAEPAAR
jgi:diguanylate cyclase (GGDEF)-like protein/PAS domain S-box-containing protein